MDADELRIAAQVLTSYWRGNDPDVSTHAACHQLERSLRDSLPKGSLGRLRRTSSTQIERVATALAQLISKPGVEALVQHIVDAQTKRSPNTHQKGPTMGGYQQTQIENRSGTIMQTMHITIVPPSAPSIAVPSKQPQLTLQLLPREHNHVEVRVLQAPGAGEGKATARLPYTADELIAVLKALVVEAVDPKRFSNEQIAALRGRGLLRQGKIDRRIHQIVGRELHAALFAEEVGEILRAALDQTRSSGALHLQLYFEKEHVDLARLPWELIHDGRRPLVKSRDVYLTRYIAYREAAPLLDLTPPFDVLYIAPRPSMRERRSLPADHDLGVIQAALSELAQDGRARIRVLSPPTRLALTRELQQRPAQIVHFDGHGSFTRMCPSCGARNYPHNRLCANETCRDDLADVAPEGLLAFEDNHRQADWSDGEDFANVLSHRGVQLVVLLACTSGVVRGETLFTGLGPGLIQSGIPAVVATQADITSDAARAFSEGLYGALARGASLAAAAAAGRDLLLTGREWFVPVVYLRARH